MEDSPDFVTPFGGFLLVLSLLALSQSVPLVVQGATSRPAANSGSGLSCTTPLNLSSTQSKSSLPTEESDPVGVGSNVYAAWAAANANVTFAASYDAGKRFGLPINLSVDTSGGMVLGQGIEVSNDSGTSITP